MKSTEIQILKLFMAKVKESMNELKLTQSQLADELEMSEVHLSNVLTAKYNPGFLTFWKLYNYFDFKFNPLDVESYK